MHLGLFGEADALTLLGRLAGTERVRAEPAASAEVIAACGGLPLAVRIAGSRLAGRPAWSMRTLADRLTDEHHRLDELVSGDLAVRARFQVTYTGLPPTGDPARFFPLLSLHGGRDASLPALAALLDKPTDRTERGLETLVDTDLLRSPSPGRYQLHDLLRVYAAECTDTSHPAQQRTAAVERLMTWYLHSAQAANRAVFPLGEHLSLNRPAAARETEFRTHQAALDWFDREHANLVAATGVAADHGLHTVAWQLPATMWGFFHLRKHWDDWISTHQIALEAARLDGDQAGEALTLNVLGIAYTDQRRFRQAIDCCRQSLAIRRRTGDRRGQAVTLNVLGAAYADRRQYAEATDCYRKALKTYRGLGNLRGEGLVLNSLGDACRRQGIFGPADQHLRRALDIQQRTDDHHSQRLTLDSLGRVYQGLRQYDRAIDLHRSSLTIRRSLGDRWGTATTLTELGNALQHKGQLTAARTCWKEAVDIFDEAGDSAGTAQAQQQYLARPLSRCGIVTMR
ncbi:tetratricopeptide repeat protein [Fodinicola feengrottensis]|uniref:tetratricopeptide repeat protein n=1 Tax=Fodinicola feengrottensis TaxID=435914 RepID=UPI0013D70E5E|nr:tetratricopeptide repeat protein [Fodinicola feengrottensis]